MHIQLRTTMEQSVNPAARVGHYTRTILTSTQNASIWSLTAAAPSDSVFRALCINWPACLLTYFHHRATVRLINARSHDVTQTKCVKPPYRHSRDLRCDLD